MSALSTNTRRRGTTVCALAGEALCCGAATTATSSNTQRLSDTDKTKGRTTDVIGECFIKFLFVCFIEFPVQKILWRALKKLI